MSLRDYYGVDPSVLGTEDVVQGSTLIFGVDTSGVNTSAVAEYLALQDLVPNVPLQLSDWAVENDVQVCLEDSDNADACGEGMLDVQAQQAFAPQAVTFFTATEKPLALLEAEAAEFLREKGYSPARITEVIKAAEATPSAPSTLDEQTQSDLNEFLTTFATKYFLEFVNNVTTSEERIQVASLSWSVGYPIDQEILEEALKNLTLSGISILVSSGDAGASGNHNSGACNPEDDPLQANQASIWPVISPWVTVVGGTQMLATEANPEGTEVVASTLTDGSITSGGGFVGPSYPSSLYSTPAWQKKFVDRYLSENNASTFDGFPAKDTPGFNTGGRAFPDIAAYAAWFPILDVRGNNVPSGGTSLAAPLTAALFTLANQKLTEDGYEVIGYANPMIYWMGENCTEAFNDITVGDNQGSDSGTSCLFGFPAAPGWDAATGFGSIKFGPFVECAKRYQDEVRSKGLEVLPDGTYNTAAAGTSSSPSPGAPSKPGSSASDMGGWASFLVAGAIATTTLLA